MELKRYQKQVMQDLTHYLALMQETQNYKTAFSLFWREKSAPSLGLYQDIMPGVPNLCFKVPTGGGKTFLACNAIRPIFEALPHTKAKVVVWLVPSDAILAQTTAALQDVGHPYRQKIDVDFGGRVNVYTKQQLLNGQQFGPTEVAEQLSIMVLSYDSFRGRGKEGLKAYQENSNLAPFAKILGKPEYPIANADETALFQIINQLSPLVIVDESHHARSELSLEMLQNFNPCFVLDLTATPKKNSNIISYVDAVQLKAEHMVKLPVIVYNRSSQSEVILDTIDLRTRLERIAQAEQTRTGRYIRPIALLQAEPKGKAESTTFEKLRSKLVEAGIPAEQIAIRTADINELKNIDLQAPTCPIRYIITVNALKEGWDCPFAYLLASLANKTSQVDVEQILGRILRLPHTRESLQPALNLSYVLTSSQDFNETVQSVIRGLNNAGFTDRDYRLPSQEMPAPPVQPTEQTALPASTPAPAADAGAEEDFADLNASALAAELKRRQETPAAPTAPGSMLQAAEKASEAYNTALQQNANDPYISDMPWEVCDKVNSYRVKPDFAADIEALCLPQFFRRVPQSLFTDGQDAELLDCEQLADGFTLKGKAYDIDFGDVDSQIRKVDVRENEDGKPKAFKMSEVDQKAFKAYFQSLPQESRIRQCKGLIFSLLNRMDMVDSGELSAYIDLIVSGMDSEQLAALEKAPRFYALKIREKIESLLEEHYQKTFFRWLDTEEIFCQPSYRLPAVIHPTTAISTIGGSLYSAEEGNMNQLETDLVMELTALPNIRWWHRNISRQGFCINGFINHYPDILIQTASGKLILAETKGEHLKNDDSRAKIALGKAWRTAAGNQYRYYMVFKDEENLLPGAVSMREFVNIVKDL
jgi:type III restriction enzyme